MRKIVESVYWVGAVDWDRRLFDCTEIVFT